MAAIESDDIELALIGQKLDRLLIDVADLRAAYKGIEERQRTTEGNVIRLQTQMEQGDRDSKVIAGVAGVAAAAIGLIK